MTIKYSKVVSVAPVTVPELDAAKRASKAADVTTSPGNSSGTPAERQDLRNGARGHKEINKDLHSAKACTKALPLARSCAKEP